MSDYETRELLLERIMIYQHDLICCLDARSEMTDTNRMKQDRAIIAELKNIWYGQCSDGLVYIE